MRRTDIALRAKVRRRTFTGFLQVKGSCVVPHWRQGGQGTRLKAACDLWISPHDMKWKRYEPVFERDHYHATGLTTEGRLGILTAVFEAASTNT